MSNPAPRAVIGCRISKTKDKKDRAGVGRQERECRKLAAALDVEVVGVYVDNNRSAYSGVQRPDYEEMLRAIERGEVDVVLAWHPDRLHRNVEEHEQWIKLVKRTRIRVVTLMAGERDLTRASDRLVARTLAAAAAYESELKAERQQAKIREKAARGEPMNGPRPFGWTGADRRKVVIKERNAIREMVDRLLAGASQGDIVHWANNVRKIRTANGTMWTVAKLRKLLLSPGIAGLRIYQDLNEETTELVTVTVQARWKPIITVEERERIIAILGEVRRHRAPSVYMLSGGKPPLLVCDLCSTPHVGAGRRGYRRYRCAQLGTMVGLELDGCGRTSQKADDLEAHVIDFALSWATSPEVISSRRAERQRVSAETSGVRRELQELKAKVQRLTDLRVDGDISPEEYRRKSQELKAEKTHLEGQLRTVESAEERLLHGGADEIRARWDDLTFNEQRKVLRSLLAEVRLRPGLRGRNVFDPERVLFRPQWPGPTHLHRELPALTASEWLAAEEAHLAQEFAGIQEWVDSM